MSPAHSSGEAARASGTDFVRTVSHSPRLMPRIGATPSRTASCIGVSTMPGRMALTLTGREASA